MDAHKAVAIALSYVEGLRASGSTSAESEASAFLEHLAGHGFVVRRRQGAEHRRLKPSALDARNISAAEIKARREALGLSVSDMSARAGIPKGTLRNLETGRVSPQSRTLCSVLDALAQAEADGGGRR